MIRGICFATFELKGFNPGGIGVLISNLLEKYGDDPSADLSILWYGELDVEQSKFSGLHPKCNFYDARELVKCAVERGAAVLARNAFLSEEHYQSYRISIALRELEHLGVVFDLVEFTDFDGAAFCALQDKKMGVALTNTLISARIHSTETVLRVYDHRPSSIQNAIRRDLERKALREADIIVGHVSEVLSSVEHYFELGRDWLDKTCCELPPVLIDGSEAEETCSFGTDTPLVFSSKIQWFKQPHVFINAAVRFLTRHPDYEGDVVFLAHVISHELYQSCLDLIPSEFIARFKFISNMSGKARDSLIAKAVVVFPSSYESFCLAAYEASMLGGLVVLNEENPGFGESSPWIDGVNCKKCGASAMAFDKALSELWTQGGSAGLSPISFTAPALPYWHRHIEAMEHRDTAVLPSQAASVTLVIAAGLLSGTGDPRVTINSALAFTGADWRFVVVYGFECESDIKQQDLSRRLKEDFELGEDRLTVINLGYRGTFGEMANAGLFHSKTTLTAFARAGAVFSADYWQRAFFALEKHEDCQVALAQVGYSALGKEAHLQMKIGEAPNTITCGANLLGSKEFVIRTSVAKDLLFDENLDRFIDVDFHLRAVLNGIDYAISNEADVLYDQAKPRVEFRRSFGSVLSKHNLRAYNSSINLVSFYDAISSDYFDERVKIVKSKVSISNKNWVYYETEERPWWKVALRHPKKALQWLILRDVQRSNNAKRGDRRSTNKKRR